MFIYKSFHILVPWNKGAGSVRDGAVIGSDLPDVLELIMGKKDKTYYRSHLLLYHRVSLVEFKCLP